MSTPTHTSPRPWEVRTRRTVLSVGSWIQDANGVPIAVNLRQQDAELIVAAVAEFDRANGEAPEV